MRQFLPYCLFTFCLMSAMIAQAQVSVSASNYTTLKSAFDAINAGTHTGAITITISGNTTETATAVLNASGTGAASYTTIAINATAAATINSNLSVATISFNGADNVNLNGNNTLQIVNTHTTGAVISLQNDASGNVIQNTTIIGNTASYTGTASAPTINAGVITFGLGTTNGNNGNIIHNCTINGNNQAVCLVYSKGLTTSSATTNYLNTIQYSRLLNYVNPSVAGAAAISIAGSDEWKIQNNSIYLTSPVTTGQQFIIRGILITPDFTTDFHTVTDNFFGGNSPSAAGTMSLTATGTNVLGMMAIDVETGGAGNTVSNNVVRNISVNYNSAAGSYSNAGFFGFIGGYNGTTAFTANEVSNVSVTNPGGFVNFSAMHFNGRVTAASTVTPTFNVTNNLVTAITGAGNAVDGTQIYGIRLETSSAASLTNTSTSKPTFNVSGNTLSNINAPNNSPATFIRGIGSLVTQGTSASALLFPNVNITNNTIHSFSAQSSLANYGSGVCTGIHYGGSSPVGNTDLQIISQNTIYNLSSTNTGNVGTVVLGILASTGVHEIARNRVYDLKNAATPTSANPGIVGINVRRAIGTSTTVNNFVSLGTGVNQGIQVIGFLQNFNDVGPINVYHNSFFITGTTGSGDKRSAAVLRGTELFGTGITTPMNLKNNILYNTRSGGTGSHYAVANTEANPATGFVSEANLLSTVNPATFALWGTNQNDLATYKSNSADLTSKTAVVNFSNTATGDLHLAGGSVGDNNLGATSIGITTDYDGATRSATRVYMGGDEASQLLPIVLSSFTGHKEGATAKLVWTSLSETNNLHFELQRSTDGLNFTKLATVQSKAYGGNSHDPITYTFTDNQTLPGANYYRLKQIDKDERERLVGTIVLVKWDINGFDLRAVYPIPTKDEVNIVVYSPAADRTVVTINDLAGKLILQTTKSLNSGINNVKLNLTSLPAGTYLLSIRDGKGELRSIQIVKK